MVVIGAVAVGVFVVGGALADPVSAWANSGYRAALDNPPDPAVVAAVAKWVTAGGSANLTTLGTDFTKLEAAADSEDLAQMGASCQQLLVDVKAAQAYDPIPDPAAEKNWANALDLYAEGAADCAAGAQRTDVDMIARASNEIVAGTGALDKVTTRLKAISGG